MSIRPRPKIALMVETSRSYGRELLKGIALFARTRTNWSLMHQEMTIDAALPDWLGSASVSGAIARVDQHSVGQLSALGVPVVDVRCRHEFPGMPRFDTDDRAVARLAFDHLRERGFERFAFCGFQTIHFSMARLRFFREAVEAAGLPLSVYESPGTEGARVSGAEQSGMMDDHGVSTWLKTLQHPTGLLACNDIRGQQVLNACGILDIQVPDQIGVIGVDDDDAICPLCDPTLSSVRPDAEGIGYRAAEALQQMMHGGQRHSRLELLAPQRVSCRRSTQVHASEDRDLAEACRFIRQHACDGINVNHVADAVRISRRQLERRFRAEFGSTLHDEITRAQVDRVKQLLRETNMTLEQITPLAGYRHTERLSVAFKRETGITPGEYRKQPRQI
ncbi:Xylose operon regulatory protein [Rubripirellula lacrimiformis]|uniref:Xylose operon regulatory protein n=1 Tax=Rubripirellula lacrimiformis TaxID=1930273 RepID=A0A517N4D1_9BACT|nr:DNA-binding transcriptional regulator [Rubripirellula lacrimiformis]QDT01989.1 Xylose operon regulatory protein [Rubripirellula lacrimiformis]